MSSIGDSDMSNNLHAVATSPAHRTAPQSPPSWADSRKLVWDTVGELRQQNLKADERRVAQQLAEREAGAHLLAHDALVAERVSKPGLPRNPAVSGQQFQSGIALSRSLASPLPCRGIQFSENNPVITLHRNGQRRRHRRDFGW
jgi:hypothetical protein